MTDQLPKDDPEVAWQDVVRFIRQLGHDIRNHLNAAELQAAYLNEVATDAETKSEIKRLREMVAEVSRSLQRVTSKITPVTINPIKYRCADFVEDVKQKLASTKSGATTTWTVQVGEAAIEIDPTLLQEVVVELFENAASHSPGDAPLAVSAAITDGQFELTLREPKKQFAAAIENWGREPLRSIGRGQYGLGLNRVRMIVAAHDGSFSARYDPDKSTLVSRIVLPLA